MKPEGHIHLSLYANPPLRQINDEDDDCDNDNEDPIEIPSFKFTKDNVKKYYFHKLYNLLLIFETN